MSATTPRTRDRRNRRSEETQKAVTYQLEHVLEQRDLDFLAVGDREGFYVAGAGDEAADKLLAAFAPALSEAEIDRREALENELAQHVDGLDDAVVVVRTFPVGNQDWYLCAVSPDDDGLEGALQHTISGVQRIFETT